MTTQPDIAAVSRWAGGVVCLPCARDTQAEGISIPRASAMDSTCTRCDARIVT